MEREREREGDGEVSTSELVVEILYILRENVVGPCVDPSHIYMYAFNGLTVYKVDGYNHGFSVTTPAQPAPQPRPLHPLIFFRPC